MKQHRREIQPSHFLYMGIRCEHFDQHQELKPELFRLPDLSCNWSLYSNPGDVRYREGGEITDGSLCMPVSEVHHDDFTITVHDPICDADIENYSHCEVRVNPGGLGADEEPPKKYKAGGKAKRRAWRKHVILKSTIAIQPEA